MMRTYQKKIADFWAHLERTIDELLLSQEDNQFDADKLLGKYRKSLHNIDRNLTFHFEKEDDGPIEMIFGCDGYPESIHSVLTLVGAAPRLSGIRFKAFNNRHDPVPSHINVADEVCELNDFWYSLRHINQKLHLELYLYEVPSMHDYDPRVEAVMIFLDALIGEFELMTRIGTLDWLELPEDPSDFNLKPLSQLRDSFDQIKHEVKPIGITLH